MYRELLCDELGVLDVEFFGRIIFLLSRRLLFRDRLGGLLLALVRSLLLLQLR